VDNGPSRKVSYDWQQALAMHLGRARGEPKALLCHTKITPLELQIIYFKLCAIKLFKSSMPINHNLRRLSTTPLP
jgi:hypothetical protein